MSKKVISVTLLIFGILMIIFGFDIINSTTLLGGICFVTVGVLLIVWSSKMSKQCKEANWQNHDNEGNKIKQCKYCKSEIPLDAKVCSHCRKTQNFSIGRVFIGLVIGLGILYLVFVANNDAPLSVRKIVCGIGLRDDYPYCYYVDTDKLNKILDRYK